MLLWIFAVGLGVAGVPVKRVDAAIEKVRIVFEESEKPQVGKKLIADVKGELSTDEPQEYKYMWTVEGKEISNDTEYIPTVADCEKWIELNVYRVIDKENYVLQLVGQDKFFFSKLPVVYINTDDGSLITEKNDYKAASMNIQGNREYKNQYKENDRIEIKLRGNLSAKYPQKPYKIKLENKSDLFGMGKNKHWVLLSNFLDECCMRNTTASNLAKRLGVDAMDMLWVDVVFNGKYTGTYILAEHIRIGKNRIDIKDWEEIAEDAADSIYEANKESLTGDDKSKLEDFMTENMAWITTDEVTYNSQSYKVSEFYSGYSKECSDKTGGYIFEMSKEYDEISKFKTESGMEVMINNPEYLSTNEEMFNYVKEYFAAYDKAACSVTGYNSYGQSLYDLADVDSMVSYWLVMEIMGNNDAEGKSRYAYKDTNGKLVFGPVWDFDWGSAARSICEMNEDVSKGWIVSGGNSVERLD